MMQKTALNKFSACLSSEKILLLTVFLLAALLRVAYWYVAKQQNFFPELFLDSLYYHNAALRLDAGFGLGDSPYLMSPLYPYWLQLFVSDGVLQVELVRFIQALTGAVTCVAVAYVGLLLNGKVLAWLSGLMAAIYGPFIHLDQAVLVASPQATTMMLALVGLLRAESIYASPISKVKIGLLSECHFYYWLAGLLLGVSCALRPTGLLLCIATAVMFCLQAFLLKGVWGQKQKLLQTKLLPFAVGVLLMVLPFTLRNVWVSGEWVLLSVNGGINFWIGNHQGSYGVFNLPPAYDLVHDPLGVDIARQQSGLPLSFTESSNWWRALAWQDIKADPLAWVLLLLRKALLFMHPLEIPQLGLNFQWFREKTVLLNLAPANGFWILLLALFAPLVMLLQKQRSSALGWLYVWLLVYAAAICLFFVTGRYRSPIMPIAIVLAIYSVQGLVWLLLRPQQNLALLLTLLAVLLGLGVGGQRLLLSDAVLPLANFRGDTELRHSGMALYQQGKYAEAEQAYRRALAQRDNPITRGNLANALKAQGKIEAALQEYQRVLQQQPQDAVVMYNLANLYRDHRVDYPRAMDLYRQALLQRPKFYQAALNLGLLLAREGEFQAAQQALESYLNHAPPTVVNREQVQAMMMEMQVRATLQNTASQSMPSLQPGSASQSSSLPR